MQTRTRRWSLALLVVALAAGALATAQGCTNKTDADPASSSSGSPGGSKNFTLKGKSR